MRTLLPGQLSVLELHARVLWGVEEVNTLLLLAVGLGFLPSPPPWGVALADCLRATTAHGPGTFAALRVDALGLADELAQVGRAERVGLGEPLGDGVAEAVDVEEGAAVADAFDALAEVVVAVGRERSPEPLGAVGVGLLSPEDVTACLRHAVDATTSVLVGLQRRAPSAPCAAELAARRAQSRATAALLDVYAANPVAGDGCLWGCALQNQTPVAEGSDTPPSQVSDRANANGAGRPEGQRDAVHGYAERADDLHGPLAAGRRTSAVAATGRMHEGEHGSHLLCEG